VDEGQAVRQRQQKELTHGTNAAAQCVHLYRIDARPVRYCQFFTVRVLPRKETGQAVTISVGCVSLGRWAVTLIFDWIFEPSTTRHDEREANSDVVDSEPGPCAGDRLGLRGHFPGEFGRIGTRGGKL